MAGVLSIFEWFRQFRRFRGTVPKTATNLAAGELQPVHITRPQQECIQQSTLGCVVPQQRHRLGERSSTKPTTASTVAHHTHTPMSSEFPPSDPSVCVHVCTFIFTPILAAEPSQQCVGTLGNPASVLLLRSSSS